MGGLGWGVFRSGLACTIAGLSMVKWPTSRRASDVWNGLQYSRVSDVWNGLSLVGLPGCVSSSPMKETTLNPSS